MQRTARENVRVVDEPSIIVDPIAYIGSEPCLLQRVCERFIGFARVVVIAVLVTITCVATAHVVQSRSLGQPHAAAAGALGDHPIAAARRAGSQSLDALVCVAAPILAKVYAHEPPPCAAAALPSVALDGAAALPKTEMKSRMGAELAAITQPSPARKLSALPPLQPVASATPPGAAVRGLGTLSKPALGTNLGASALERPGVPPKPALRTNLVTRADELAQQARQALARGKFDEALSLARRAVDAAPQRAALHVTLGDALRLRGEPEAAAVQYELAKRLDPQRALPNDRVLPTNPF